MAYLQQKYLNIPKGICGELSCGYRGTKHDRIGLNDWRWKNAGQIRRFSENTRSLERERGSSLQRLGSFSPTSSVEEVEWQYGNLVSEYGWNVRRMIEKEDEMRKVAQIQAEAFHVPVFLFNDLFFQYFKAEVLSGLLYRLRNSAPDRYACLVAENVDATESESRKELVGVVDVTVFRDGAVLQHLPGAEEYLYVSGIAVLNKFRRQKVATALLKACDVLSVYWGFKYLVLRAYEDDSGARQLYANAGYRIVAGDPPWMSTWIGRKRRVLMIKQSNLCE